MLHISFPVPGFRFREEEGNKYIFDDLRRKWLQLTPEEWVRQNFIQYLIQVKAYPASLIAIEKEIRLGELSRRFDLLVYNRDHQPWMMIECKAMTVRLDEKVLEQLIRYHLSVPVEYLVITNGRESQGWQKAGGQLHTLSELPVFGQ